jgi:ABC-type nitrate/sulfonate/bicarbonate transport system substrate-binding protein
MSDHVFIIEPHFRLQEWVAEEKGYFADEGLDYVFQEKVQSTDGQVHDQGGRKAGAFQSFEAGRTSDVSCACHWTVNVAAAKGHGKLWADIYSVAPSGIFVPPDSDVRRPEDLAGVPISVGFQSGSHYATIQALERCLPREAITLSFAEGMLFKRLDNLLEGRSPASCLFSGPYYLAEQLGYRKVIDTTFMIAAMLTGDPRAEDLKKFFRALQRAQRDIDLRPELYTHYYKNEFPTRYHPIMDTRRWGPGERIVFEPYTPEAFAKAREWIGEHAIFDGGRADLGSDRYQDVAIRVG